MCLQFVDTLYIYLNIVHIVLQLYIQIAMVEQYVCVLDFEATCWDGTDDHEIIEFPSVLWRWTTAPTTFQLVDSIQLFVRPTHNPTVSAFCEGLTGISQAQVDAGITLESALAQHHAWLRGHVPDTSNVKFVTCGDWDIKTMLPRDMQANKLPYPASVYKNWVNVKQLFDHVTKSRKSMSMVRMLGALDLQLEGRHHSGIDDCRNISKIVRKLVELGLSVEHFRGFVRKL